MKPEDEAEQIGKNEEKRKEENEGSEKNEVKEENDDDVEKNKGEGNKEIKNINDDPNEQGVEVEEFYDEIEKDEVKPQDEAAYSIYNKYFIKFFKLKLYFYKQY